MSHVVSIQDGMGGEATYSRVDAPRPILVVTRERAFAVIGDIQGITVGIFGGTFIAAWGGGLGVRAAGHHGGEEDEGLEEEEDGEDLGGGVGVLEHGWDGRW
jgi:hypothetical protein